MSGLIGTEAVPGMTIKEYRNFDSYLQCTHSASYHHKR
jgi:hypothetical protein